MLLAAAQKLSLSSLSAAPLCTHDPVPEQPLLNYAPDPSPPAHLLAGAAERSTSIASSSFAIISVTGAALSFSSMPSAMAACVTASPGVARRGSGTAVGTRVTGVVPSASSTPPATSAAFSSGLARHQTCTDEAGGRPARA